MSSTHIRNVMCEIPVGRGRNCPRNDNSGVRDQLKPETTGLTILHIMAKAYFVLIFDFSTERIIHIIITILRINTIYTIIITAINLMQYIN